MCNFAHSFANQFNFYIMKRISMFFVGLAMIAFTACSTLSNSASTNTAAMLSGQQCAAAITTLYNSYKALGKIDLTNAANLSSALIVATCYTQLKANKNDANYRPNGRSWPLYPQNAGHHQRRQDRKFATYRSDN